MSYEKTFLDHLSTIESIIRCICRRYRMSADECQDFGSEVKFRLIEDDYRILRAWEGREGASIQTYLTTVIVRMRLDFVRQKTGKYCSSAEAGRLGPYAVALERLLVQDGRTFKEAFEQLRPQFPEVSEKEAEAIAAQLPPRTKWQNVGEDMIVALPAPGADPETEALDRERAERKKQLLALLAEARNRLLEEDRLIVRLLYEEGWKRVTIARHLHHEPKPFYRRIEGIRDELRGLLESRGLHWEKLREIFENEIPEDDN